MTTARATASPLLTVDEAAAYLRKSRTWLYRHADQVGCVRDGGALRFRQARLDAWIERHEKVLPPVREVPRRGMKPPTFAIDPTRINPLDGQPYGSAVR